VRETRILNTDPRVDSATIPAGLVEANILSMNAAMIAYTP
jgi:hypothetical protein